MAKVLLVEDDNNLREIYEARLQAEGYTIVSAKDGEEALVVAKAEKPDLVVADVMMPKISGFEMLDILHNTPELKDVKVIMLTALGQSEDQQRADQLGADRYLVKSQVTLEDIVKATHELLNEGTTPDTDSTPDAAAAVPAPAEQQAAPVTPPSATTPDTTAPTAPATSTDTTSSTPAPSTDPGDDADDTAATPAIEDTATPGASDNTVQSTAQSTAQEESEVEAKIEDFVAGATSEPTTPSKSGAADTPAEPASASEPTPNEAAITASDDKLMSEAVDKLVASTETPGAADAAASESSSAPTAPVVPAPDVTPVAPPAPLATDTDAKPAETAPETKAAEAEPQPPTGDGTISHKKVIKPLENTPKKSLDELLAEEEAEEAKAAGSTPGTVIEEDKASGAPPSGTGATGSTTPGDADPSGGVAL